MNADAVGANGNCKNLKGLLSRDKARLPSFRWTYLGDSNWETLIPSHVSAFPASVRHHRPANAEVQEFSDDDTTAAVATIACWQGAKSTVDIFHTDTSTRYCNRKVVLDGLCNKSSW